MSTLWIYKKKLYVLILLLIYFVLLFTSCTKKYNDEIDEPQKNDKKLFIVEAYFNYQENQNKRYPDVGAKVYIYFSIPTYNFFNSTYLGDGAYNNKNKIIKPDAVYTIDNDGSINIEYLYPEKDITIIIESNKMKPINSFHLYSPLNPPKKIVTVFTITY